MNSMEIKDAIHKMHFMKQGYQRLLEERVKDGSVLGYGIKGYWEASTPMTEIYQAHIDACDLAITALKKMEAEQA